MRIPKCFWIASENGVNGLSIVVMIVNRETDRRVLTAYINGLIGEPGLQVRPQMPDTIDKALNMAIVETNADREERNLREERGVNK